MIATGALEAYSLGISLGREATGILEQGGYRLVLLHLIGHRALDITRHVDYTVVRTYDNHIVVLQAYITRETTIENIIIDIDH